MKYLSLITLFITSTTILLAQSSGIDRYYEQYQDDDRFTHVTVSSRMFGLFVNFEMDDPAEQELVKTISKLKGLKMLVGTEISDANEIYKNAVKKPESVMDELMSVKDGDAQFKFFVSESNGKISELLMVGHESSKVLILSLVGEIDLKQIAALSQKMNIEGFEHFKNIGE